VAPFQPFPPHLAQSILQLDESLDGLEVSSGVGDADGTGCGVGCGLGYGVGAVDGVGYGVGRGVGCAVGSVDGAGYGVGCGVGYGVGAADGTGGTGATVGEADGTDVAPQSHRPHSSPQGQVPAGTILQASVHRSSVTPRELPIIERHANDSPVGAGVCVPDVGDDVWIGRGEGLVVGDGVVLLELVGLEVGAGGPSETTRMSAQFQNSSPNIPLPFGPQTALPALAQPAL